MNSPNRYGQAYLYTETDSGDLTYFIHYHLRVVNIAIDQLHKYLEQQQQRRREGERLLEDYPQLNMRQRAVIQDALKHRNQTFTAREHEGKFRVTYNTARADLQGLAETGLLCPLSLSTSS